MLSISRAAAVNAQIRAYKEFHKVGMAIIPVIKSFDGKVFNKRFTDALNAATLPDGCDCNFTVDKTYQFDIRCHTYNRSYKNEPNATGYSSTGYIDYDDMTVRTPIEDALIDGRINADAIIENVKKEAEKNRDYAGNLESARDRYDILVMELQDIADRLKDFNDKYDYCAREVLGLNFEMRHYGSNNDYVIRT